MFVGKGKGHKKACCRCFINSNRVAMDTHTIEKKSMLKIINNTYAAIVAFR